MLVRARPAFTLIELLVVIAVIALLATLLLPALARAKTHAQTIKCLNNMKQFSVAWLLYADDHNDVVVPNIGSAGLSALSPETWVRGWLDNNFFESWADNTNTIFLTESLLAPYLNHSIPVWRCPADKSASRFNGQYLPRVRSYSMNAYLNSPNVPPGRPWKTFRKITDMTDPPPSGIYVIIDERQDSIQDCLFVIDMDDEPASLESVPRSSHAGAGTLSFADGHAESKKWRDPRSNPVQYPFGPVVTWSSPPANPDVLWLRARTTGVK